MHHLTIVHGQVGEGGAVHLSKKYLENDTSLRPSPPGLASQLAPLLELLELDVDGQAHRAERARAGRAGEAILAHADALSALAVAAAVERACGLATRSLELCARDAAEAARAVARAVHAGAVCGTVVGAELGEHLRAPRLLLLQLGRAVVVVRRGAEQAVPAGHARARAVAARAVTVTVKATLALAHAAVGGARPAQHAVARARAGTAAGAAAGAPAGAHGELAVHDKLVGRLDAEAAPAAAVGAARRVGAAGAEPARWCGVGGGVGDAGRPVCVAGGEVYAGLCGHGGARR